MERRNYDTAEGAFNSALATLQRIHTSLERIRIIFESYEGVKKQKMHIEEVKIFFMMASPLLSDKTIENYSEEIDNLRIRTKIIKGKKFEHYSYSLESRLFQLIRIFSIELRPYFMKYSQDIRKAIISSN